MAIYFFFRNTGTVNSPIFAAPITNPFGLSDVGIGAKPTFVDIDGDGDLDAFVGNGGSEYNGYSGHIEFYGGDTLFFRNMGTVSNPLFAAPITNPFGLSNVGYGAKPTFVDLDGDGDLDAFIGNAFNTYGSFGGNTLFFKNVGTISSPVFSNAIINPFGLNNVGYYSSPTFIDIDNDGDLDVLVGAGSGNTGLQRNTGTINNPIFNALSFNPFNLSYVGFSIESTFVDIDGDGDRDAFIGIESIANEGI